MTRLETNESRAELRRLDEAAEALEDEGAIVSWTAEALLRLCPRATALVYTIRGRPARAVGAIRLLSGSSTAADARLGEFQRLFASEAPLFYDRYHVTREQRNRWVDLPPTWFRECAFRPALAPFAAMSRVVVCLGARPVGCIGLLLPEGEAPFDEEERGALEALAPRTAGPLRVASLLAEAADHLDAVEHLMAGRGDAAFLVSEKGRLLSCSEPARLAMERTPGLLDAVLDAARRVGVRAETVASPRFARSFHVTPCSRRGGSPVRLVLIGSESGGRSRLSGRQAELLGHLASGLSNASIGERMGVSAATVKTMLERLYRREGVSGRVALLGRLAAAPASEGEEGR